MMKPRKAYLIEAHTGRPGSYVGFGVHVQAVLVLDYRKGESRAIVAPFSLGGTRVVLNAARSVPLAQLAGSRLKALARVALALLDIETTVAAHFAVTPEPASIDRPTPEPASVEPATIGGPRRDPRPWYARD